MIILACTTSDRALLERADREALNQRANLAKHFYVDILQRHKSKDEIRFRALQGLVEVSLTQLFDYPSALKLIEQAIEEYGNDPSKGKDILELRLKASGILRAQMQQPTRAKEILSPLLEREDLSSNAHMEIGRTLLAVRDFENAEKHFRWAWEDEYQTRHCEKLQSIQLDLLQVYILSRRCEVALKMSEMKFPSPCQPDARAIDIERAHCLEILGEPQKSEAILSEFIRKDPQDSRAHFLLESLRRRQKEKSRR